MSNTPLPAPWDYCYEWDGPFGTRKFSAASHNGSRPDRSVPIYTPDQMHTHAAAVTREKDAEIAGLRAELDRLRQVQRSLSDKLMAERERIKVLEEALADLLSLYDQRIPLRERPTTWEAARAALGDKTPNAGIQARP